ncbi:MAG: LytTR family DNA-binding domain-containing protein [Bacteroidota bacterium]|nr:LytTR family DNA-binding domain-containing protein [Bacteroidota bacterium]
MNKLNAIIIDDSISILETLNLMLNDYFKNEIDVLGSFLTAEEGLKFTIENEPDVIFLDIEMNNINGFEFIQLLPSTIHSKIVIISGFEKYAIDAIKLSVFDYLVKPISLIELKNTIEKITKSFQISYHKFIELNNNVLIINRQDKAIFIDLNKISKVEADGSCTNLYYDDKKLSSTKSFKHYDAILPKESFIKIHRSYLVNINFIEEIIKQDGVGYLVLVDGSRIEMSKSKKDELMNRLMTFIKN